MNRFLRIAVVITAVLLIVATSFLMGFGTAVLINGATASEAVAAPPALASPYPTYTPTTPSAAVTPATSAPTNTPAVSSRGAVRDVQDRFQLFWDALRKISDNYYDQSAINPQAIVYGAIKGMVETLNDPHTYFSSPQQVQRSKEDLEGAYGGIGAYIDKKDDRLLIVSPIAGTPALRAGLKAADWITRIDGQSTASLSADDCVALIRGPQGTKVTLTVMREGIENPFDVVVVREVINVPNVKLTMLDDNIAHVALVNIFSTRLTDELKVALKEARAKGATKIILDLRGNPGGYLDISIEVASQFLKSGVVAYELTRDGKKTPFPVLSGGQATDWPMVVLVNKGSASASEIVAGAIQDTGRAILIGETTYGKGSVQQDFSLSDGSAVHVTVADWLTAKGRSISKVGLKPDIEVKITEEDVKADRDTQLERAVEYLKTGK